MSEGINGHDIYCNITYQTLLDSETCHYCVRLRAARREEREAVEQTAYNLGRAEAALAISRIGAPPELVNAARGPQS